MGGKTIYFPVGMYPMVTYEAARKILWEMRFGAIRKDGCLKIYTVYNTDRRNSLWVDVERDGMDLVRYLLVDEAEPGDKCLGLTITEGKFSYPEYDFCVWRCCPEHTEVVDAVDLLQILAEQVAPKKEWSQGPYEDRNRNRLFMQVQYLEELRDSHWENAFGSDVVQFTGLTRVFDKPE